MTKKPSRLEKAAEKQARQYCDYNDAVYCGARWFANIEAFEVGARWAYRALLREMKKDHMDCSIAELRYLWRRISKGEK